MNVVNFNMMVGLQGSGKSTFVKKELSFTETGIKVDLSPAKRYSYLVGENEAVHTAQEYLFKLFEKKMAERGLYVQSGKNLKTDYVLGMRFLNFGLENSGMYYINKNS